MKYPIGIQTFERIRNDDFVYVGAVGQINAKGYARECEADKRKPYKIGVNISTKTGTASDWLAE